MGKTNSHVRETDVSHSCCARRVNSAIANSYVQKFNYSQHMNLHGNPKYIQRIL